MDESAGKGLEIKGSDAANQKSRDIGRISVTGYDTKRCLEHVERDLKELYASCGEITDVFIRKAAHSLGRYAIIYLVGQGAVDKALQLNGSDMGGWTVSAEPFPFLESANRHAVVKVEGFDSPPTKRELTKLFSSCGKINTAYILKSCAVVFLEGEDVAEKVPKLNGCDMGGCKVVVKIISYTGKSTVHRRRVKGGRFGRTL